MTANWKKSAGVPKGEFLSAPGRDVAVGEVRERPSGRGPSPKTSGRTCGAFERSSRGGAPASDSDFEEADRVSSEELPEGGTQVALLLRVAQLEGERLHSTGSSALILGERSVGGAAQSKDLEGETLHTDVPGEPEPSSVLLMRRTLGALRWRTGLLGGGGRAEGSGSAASVEGEAVRAVCGGEEAPSVEGEAVRSRSHRNGMRAFRPWLLRRGDRCGGVVRRRPIVGLVSPGSKNFGPTGGGVIGRVEHATSPQSPARFSFPTCSSSFFASFASSSAPL